DLLSKYPNAKFKAMSYLDEHPDHRATGLALQTLHDEGDVLDARFYMKTSQFGTDSIKGTYFEKAKPEHIPFIEAGVEVYKRWAPELGLYSVGYLSVPKSFDILLKEKRMRIHRPYFQL